MTMAYCLIKGHGRALSTHELGDLMLGARCAFCAEVILSNGTRKIWLEDLKDDIPGLQTLGKCLITGDSDSDSDSDSDIDWFQGVT